MLFYKRLSASNISHATFAFDRPAILLQVLILTIFSIFDPSKEYNYVDVDASSIFQHHICKHDTVAFQVTQLVFEGSMVLFGCALAWKTRNLGSTLGEAKQLLFAMYNVALVALIVLLMGTLLAVDQKSVYVIMTVGIFWSTVFSSCAFVLPRLLQIQRNSMRRRNSSGSRGSSYFQSINKGTGSISSSFQTTNRISAQVAVGGSMYVEPRSKVISNSSAHTSDYNVDLSDPKTQSEPWTISNDGQNSFCSIGSMDDVHEHELCESDKDDDHVGSHSDDGEEEKQKSRRTSITRVPSGKSIDSFELKDADIEASIEFE